MVTCLEFRSSNRPQVPGRTWYPHGAKTLILLQVRTADDIHAGHGVTLQTAVCVRDFSCGGSVLHKAVFCVGCLGFIQGSMMISHGPWPTRGCASLPMCRQPFRNTQRWTQSRWTTGLLRLGALALLLALPVVAKFPPIPCHPRNVLCRETLVGHGMEVAWRFQHQVVQLGDCTDYRTIQVHRMILQREKKRPLAPVRMLHPCCWSVRRCQTAGTAAKSHLPAVLWKRLSR